jgi:predicted RNase H-like nuclease
VRGWIAGVDGCRAGWIVARQEVTAPDIRVTVHSSFAAILDGADTPLAIAVDMPIGLPERIGQGGRGPERLIRPLLGARQSSVFAIPSRAAVEAPDYGAACVKALSTSDPPRKVSKQAFMLFQKIREIDALLRSASVAVGPPLRERIFEAHPELAFWRLNAERSLRHPKKIKGRPNPDGLRERANLLIAGSLPPAIVTSRPPPGAAEDDLLDSLALLCAARRIRDGKACSFPDPPGRDAQGLPIAIWG